MAATVASSAPFPPSGGLHPIQIKAQSQQHQQQQSGSVPDGPSLSQIASERRLAVADFKRVRTLGTGTFARVCLVRPATGTEADRNSVYALKILRKTEVIKLRQIDHVRHERQILAEVSGHPFITNLQASFSDDDFLYLLLDYVPGGELFSYLRKWRRFDEDMARFYAAEIVLVLEYLHEQQGGIAYRDLKPENLLLDEQGHIKLVDFGFAKRLGNNENRAEDKPQETYTLCGTPEYLAPEVIHNKGHTTAVDWWALGILIYEFLTGYPPFWHQNPIEIYKQYAANSSKRNLSPTLTLLLCTESSKSPSSSRKNPPSAPKQRTSSGSSAPSTDRTASATSAAARRR
jgi:protein kinase A